MKFSKIASLLASDHHITTFYKQEKFVNYFSFFTIKKAAVKTTAFY